MRRFPVLVVALLLAAVAALPASARAPSPPTVDVHGLGVMAPDARSIRVQVLASCDERAAVVQAVVAVSQPSGSGRAPIPLTCGASCRCSTSSSRSRRASSASAPPT